jgi:hypothetical protein
MTDEQLAEKHFPSEGLYEGSLTPNIGRASCLAALREQREESYRVLCQWCAKGQTAIQRYKGSDYTHFNHPTDSAPCKASALRSHHEEKSE